MSIETKHLLAHVTNENTGKVLRSGMNFSYDSVVCLFVRGNAVQNTYVDIRHLLHS